MAKIIRVNGETEEINPTHPNGVFTREELQSIVGGYF
jgi:hypothetical protein